MTCATVQASWTCGTYRWLTNVACSASTPARPRGRMKVACSPGLCGMAQLRPRRAGAPALQLDAVDGIQILRTGEPDEVREFDLGRLELYRIGTLQIGRAIYEPGWRWSEHVRPVAGTDLCEIGHVGLVVSGSAAVRMAN